MQIDRNFAIKIGSKLQTHFYINIWFRIKTFIPLLMHFDGMPFSISVSTYTYNNNIALSHMIRQKKKKRKNVFIN